MKTVQVIFRIFCLCILVMAVVQVAFMDPARSSEQVPTASPEVAVEAPKSEPAPKDATAGAIAGELEAKRLAIESRSTEVDEQEHRLKEREKDLDRKLKEMERLRAAVSGELEGQKKHNEEKVTKIVAVFETMTPKSAAGVMETLDDWLAVEVMKQMDVKKVAKMMNIMDKGRSAKLSELLTGFYRPEKDRSIASVKQAGQVVQKPLENKK